MKLFVISVVLLGSFISSLAGIQTQAKTSSSWADSNFVTNSKPITKDFRFQSGIDGSFKDVPISHTFAKFIYNLKDHGVISGYSATSFVPEGQVTREQMAKFLKNGIFGKNHTNLSCAPFADVSSSHPFYTEITTLKCDNIISGFTPTTFKPKDLVTRGQAMKFLINGVRIKVGDNQFLSFDSRFVNFQDDVPQNHPFYDFIQSAAAWDIVSGYSSSRFAPDEPIRRGAMSKMIWNTMLSQNLKVPPLQLVQSNDTTFRNVSSIQDVYECGSVTGEYSIADHNMLEYFMNVFSLDFVMPIDYTAKLANSKKIILQQTNFTIDPQTNYKLGLLPLFGINCNLPDFYVIQEYPGINYTTTDGSYGVVNLILNEDKKPGLSVIIYGVKGNNVIALNKYLKEVDLSAYFQSCKSTSSSKTQILDCLKQAIAQDNQIQTTIQNVQNTLTSKFAIK